MGVVERYLAAVAGQDWATVSECVTDDVRRVGPFGDVYEGRGPYIDFLRKLMPALAAYRMDVGRVVSTERGDVVFAELSETVEMDGRTLTTPESLVFDLDRSGRIAHISIYIQTE